jgi:hypothetical protein
MYKAAALMIGHHDRVAAQPPRLISHRINVNGTQLGQKRPKWWTDRHVYVPGDESGRGGFAFR